MTKKSYAVHVSIILGSTVVLMLFIFILVAHHRSIGAQVQQHRSALQASASGVAERIKPVGQVSVPAAGTPQEPAKVAAAAAPPPPAGDGQQVFQTTCIACHGAGIAGAPKLGDKGQWAARIAKGVDILYASSVNGIQGSGGVMPPKGGNLALSDAEVRAAVDYMIGQSK